MMPITVKSGRIEAVHIIMDKTTAEVIINQIGTLLTNTTSVIVDRQGFEEGALLQGRFHTLHDFIKTMRDGLAKLK